MSKRLQMQPKKLENEEELPSNVLLKRVFEKRRKGFVSALQETLYHISHDKVVREILQNKCTAQFLADRVGEIFFESLNRERNNFLISLYQKVQRIETIYLSKHVERLKDIENKLIAAANEQSSDEKNHMKQIIALNEQVKALQNEIATLNTEQLEKHEEIAEQTEKEKTISILQNPTHIYANLDLTETMTKIKLIQAESDSMHRVAHVFFKNTKSLFKYLKTNITKQIQIHEKDKIALADKIKSLNHDLEACKQNYEENIIPSIKKDIEIKLNNQISINNKYSEQIANLQNELSKLNIQYQQIQPENLQLKSQLKIFEDKSIVNDKEIANLQSELRREKEYSQKVNEDLELKKSLVDRLQIDKSAAERDKLLFQQSNTRLSNQNAEKDAQIKKLQDELAERRKQFTEVDLKRDELEKSLQTSSNQYTLLNEKVTKLEPELRHTKNQLELFKDKYNKMKSSLEKTQQENAKNSDLVIQYEHNISNLTEELEKIQALLKSSERKAADLQTNFKSQGYQLKNAQDRANKFENENEKLQKDLVDQQLIISTQKAKIETLGNFNEKLSQRQTELEKQNEILDNENRKATTEITQYKSQLREQMVKDDDNQQKFFKLQNDVAKLKDDLQQARNELQTANSERNHAKQMQEDADAENVALKEQNTILQNENEDLKKKTVDGNLLSVQLNETSERNKALTNQNNSLQKQLMDLASISRDTKAIIDEVQRFVPFKSAQDLANKLNDLRNGYNLSTKIKELVNADNDEQCIANIKELNKSHQAIQKIQAEMPGVALKDIVAQIEHQKSEIERLNAEQKRIFEMLSAEPNVDISKTIQDLLYQQRHVGEQLISAADFISEVLSIVTGSSTGTSLVFPLKKDERQKLLELVTRIKKRFDDDHQTVETIIERSRARGYSGMSAIEAAEFDSDNANTQKTVMKLKDTLSKKIETSSRREEQLLAENARLMQEIEEQKRIRSEMGRIFASGSGDISLLRSNLNESEFAVIDFIQQMKQKEKASAKLQQMQKKSRESLLGSSSSGN